MHCITENAAVALVQGALDTEDAEQTRVHAEQCDRCRTLVAALARMSMVRRLVDTATTTIAGDATPPPAHAAGELIAGRYVVGPVIGVGGMGVVYQARDVTLDRVVALKRVRCLERDVLAGAQGRLVSEARAMAQLSHPAIVTVYDAGISDDAAFVAMEHIEGETLRAWLAMPRGWREIVAVFVQAARGLAAAHAAGVVHGDFKPDNALVARSGKLQVVDFGLARVVGPAAGEDARRRALAGTLAYMAPEQRAGGGADVATDQYAFWVSLHEALHGARPPVRGARRVPRWLDRAIARGLAEDPLQRFSDLASVGSVLERGLGRRRRVATALAIAAAATVIALTASAMARETETCTRPTDRLAGVWDDTRRTAIATAFRASHAPGADDAIARVDRTFDAYGDRWLDLHVEACQATRAGTQSAALLDLRVACLEDRRRDWRALGDVFAAAEPEVVTRAPESALRLADPSTCSDARALTAIAAPPDDPASRARLAAVRDLIAEAKALRVAGKYAAGLARAKVAAEASKTLGYAPLTAQALFWRGDLENRTGSAGEATLTDAALAGLAGRDFETTAMAWTGLAYDVGYTSTRGAEGLRWARHAEALLDASDERGPLRARLEEVRGSVLSSMGKLDEARAAFERSIAISTRIAGANAPETLGAQLNIAEVMRKQGTFDEAQRRLEAALHGLEAAFGPEHPWVAQAHNNLAYILKARGDYAAALAHITKAVELREKLLGPDHPELAKSLYLVATLYRLKGDDDKALATYRRTLAIEQAAKPDSAELSTTLGGLARLYADRGDFAEALATHQQALVIQHRLYGAEHYEISITLTGIGDALDGLGRRAEALAQHRAAVAMAEKVIGPESPNLVYSLSAFANCLESAGQLDEALRVHARAAHLIAASGGAEGPEMATYYTDIGHIYITMRDGKHALDAYQRAAAIDDKTLEKDDPERAHALTGIGQSQLLVGDPKAALAVLERADKLREHAPVIRRAETWFQLAQAIVQTGGDRAHARELATTARAAYAAATEPDKAAIHDIDGWLATLR